ncbi:MAG: GIY-YIG nuclease family protein [Gemmatimonadota bacterium]|nr:GIY-YIG nuclease family protein [Gemmatimonadota bacterium]
MPERFTDEDDALLAELGVEVEPRTVAAHTPREERIIAGFEDIQRFVEREGHAPRHGEDRDIFERLYAVRLDRLRELGECRTLLEPLDRQGLLSGATASPAASAESMTDEELLAELGADADRSDLTELRHVRARAEIRAAEEIARADRCEDFESFRPRFEQAQKDLKSGVRQARPFGRDAAIALGEFFILAGQMVYVAEMGEKYWTPEGAPNARLRVIFANGTESNLLLRSLQAALYKDEAARRLTVPDAGPLFGDTWDDDDLASGTIYVLRSLSAHPFIAKHRELIHKIGVTGGRVESRIANAAQEATYLLADVEVVAQYKLARINRTKLENVFHRVFAAAQIEITITDRFGQPVRPHEWFLVPLHVIDQAVGRVRDGSIAETVYDPAAGEFVPRGT